MNNANWRLHILKKFDNAVGCSIIVTDPDHLLGDELLLFELKTKGFNLLWYEDIVEFRYFYEKDFRVVWERGEQKYLIIVFQHDVTDLPLLPYDILGDSTQIDIGLSEIFPKLNYGIVSKLDIRFYDQLYSAHGNIVEERLGRRASLDIVLQHVYKLIPEVIYNPKDLLSALVRFHYDQKYLPGIFAQRCVEVLSRDPSLAKLPLNMLFSDHESFMAFLEKGWKCFIELQVKSTNRYQSESQGFSIEWDIDPLYFNDPNIKSYVENFFLEGELTPIKHELVLKERPAWYHIGLIGRREIKEEMLRALISKAEEHLQGSSKFKHTDWYEFAGIWAKIKHFNIEMAHQLQDKVSELRALSNRNFSEWIRHYFDGLINLPPVTPVMVHHILRYLARRYENNPNMKIALIVIDGMSYWQWLVIQNMITQTDKTLSFRHSGVFAWVPTTTSISRQSIFSGKTPIHFSKSLLNTSKEERLWKDFWAEQGVRQNEVQYFRQIEDKDLLENLSAKTKILGLVINTIDKIMHGMQLGDDGMYNQVHQWCEKEYLCDLINNLMERGFHIWLASDHGNVETVKTISITDGEIASSRGERTRLYNSKENRDAILSNEFVQVWDSVGLPENIYPVLASSNYSFSRKSGDTIAHGGASIEEVIVPFIEVGRSNG